jgi:plastocyanin
MSETEVPPSGGAPHGRMVVALCAVAATVLAVMGLMSLSGGSAAPAASGREVAATSGMTMPSPAVPGVPVGGPGPGAAQPAATPPAAAAPPASGGTAATAAKVIHIKNYAFSPASITVPVGTKVTWINDDTAAHTATTTSGPKSFDSGSLAKGKSFSYTFTTAGTYSYYCAYHPDMKGTVKVTGGSTGGGGGGSGGGTGGGTGGGSGGGTTPCTGAIDGMLTMFMQHMQTAHLQEPVDQQIADIRNIQKYLSTHMALIGTELQTADGERQALMKGLIPLVQHVETAHLQEPVDQQIADITNLNKYLTMHLNLIDAIVSPGLNGLVGGGC